jgi:RNA recognition motif-containing protein
VDVGPRTVHPRGWRRAEAQFEKERNRKMSQKLFVGGLSWGTGREELEQAFAQFGELLEVTVVTDRETAPVRR